MIIDNNPKEKEAMKAFHKGDRSLGHKIQDEFVEELRASLGKTDHCSCQKACKYHGKCIECVAIHRAHREHLPNCFRSMVNERIEKLSELTEHTALEQIEK
ncbi:LPS biosynthesis protein [Lutispora saccharofermentans]|uniref:LPS biosynthesis protein n=1 Tax=Lutispora saccharofermentans TaxID=3024236 RepID=A0ABT1NDT2_9FIRM|nr:LPS biosynthesis protein [Lutispora saccharofermentans]MCQ1529286.1 LPS biosynthesis protein [Lutispora saccharofermentans]